MRGNLSMFFCYCLYVGLLILMIINDFTLVYRVESVIYLQYLLYALICIVALFYLHKTKDIKAIILVGILLLFRYGDIFYFLPMIYILKLILSSIKINSKFKTIFIIIASVGICSCLLISLVSMFEKNTTIEISINEGNINKSLVVRHWILGETINVSFQQKLLGDYVKLSRVLFSTNEAKYVNTKIFWIDSETAMIRSYKMNVYTSKIMYE